MLAFAHSPLTTPSPASGHELDALWDTHTHAHAHTSTRAHTHTRSLALLQGSRVVLAWHKGRFVVPALDFRACTHASFAVMVSRMHNTYTHIHLFLRQRNGRRRDCGGRSVQLPCSPALAFLYLWPLSPLAIIHGSFASSGAQQCRKDGIIASLICSRPVTAPLAVPGSAC